MSEYVETIKEKVKEENYLVRFINYRFSNLNDILDKRPSTEDEFMLNNLKQLLFPDMTNKTFLTYCITARDQLKQQYEGLLEKNFDNLYKLNYII
tara:strand:+ start:59 stop:343 length:285 start_codon:yes stop_codon:yes gene_type:complete